MSELTNEPKVTDDDVLAVNLSKIVAAQHDAAVSNEDLKDVLKDVATKGVDVKAAKKALGIVKTGKVDEWIDEMATITHYLRVLRHAVSSDQIEMFKVEEVSAPIDEKAGMDGRAAGLMGRSEIENPHDLSTDAGQAWLAAFRDGAAQRELVLKMQEEPKETLIPANHPDAEPTLSRDEFSDEIEDPE